MLRVAVTTAVDRSEVVADAVRRAGLIAVVLPCLEVEPASEPVLARLRAAAAASDLIVATSGRAVRITWPVGGMPPVPVAAVGRATARAVTEAGGRVEVVGEQGAAALAGALEGRVRGRTVAFPHARGADPSTVRRLEASGATVAAEAVYETVPVGPGPDPVDGVLFGSPSAVRGWYLTRTLDSLVVGAVGPTTAEALAGYGHPAEVVAPRPDLGALAAALGDALVERRRT